MKYSASFGDGESKSAYRFALRRDWTDELTLFTDAVRGPQHALFIMLNPSTADAEKNDPTVAKCIRLSQRWGFGALEVRNIFPLRSTDPSRLRKELHDPKITKRNMLAIAECLNDPNTGIIVAAWGNHGSYLQRAVMVRDVLAKSGVPVYCFKISDQGQPVHPLYQTEVDLEEMQRWL
jgi:hypothetical protein